MITQYNLNDIFIPDSNKELTRSQYHLTRLDDNLINTGYELYCVYLTEDGETRTSDMDIIVLGGSLVIMEFHRWWQTTAIKTMEYKENSIIFTTQNSTYKLEKRFTYKNDEQKDYDITKLKDIE